MAGESSEMDSLFEGMDFVMPVENDNDIPFVVHGNGHENAITKALEATEVVAPESLKANAPIPIAPVSSLPSLDPGLGLPSVSSTTALPPSRSLSPTPASPSTQQLVRDHSEPLDESLFSGLTLAVEDESIAEFNPEELANGMETNLTTGTSSIDSASAKISKASIQLEKSVSFHDSLGGVRTGNDDKDAGSIESTMSAYNDGSPYSASVKISSSGAIPLSRSSSGISSTVSPPVKPSMRRKKRSMKIGYGREDEENDELGLRKAGIRDVFGAALLGKDTVNPSSTSAAKPAFSRESSQGAISIEDSILGSTLGGEIPRLNGVELAKENSVSRLSSASQYSSFEVDGIERVESRDISGEIGLQVEIDNPEVIAKRSDVVDVDKQDSPGIDQSHSSALQEVKVDVEEAYEPPCAAVEETMADVEVASEAPRMDPEITTSTIENESASHLAREEGGAEAIQDKEDDFDFKPLAQPREGTIEERLELIKEAVAHTLKVLHEKISAVSALRKTAVQKRRRAAEKVATALARHRELEAELEAACEREDFEKADSVSGMIAEAETSMAQAGEAFALAEAESDLAASKVQDVLDFQVAVEEQGATFLELLKQEAEDAAEKTFKEAQEIADRETERLEAEGKSIEVRQKKLDLELNDVEEAQAELDTAIDELTQTESKEKAKLTDKRDQLSVELRDLIILVRMKEAEIAECNERIARVDEKISTVASTFEDQRTLLTAQLEAIATSATNMEKDSSVVAEGRQGIEQLLADAEEKRNRLENSARLALDAGKSMRDDVKIKKSVAVAIMQSRKKRTELAEKEKQAQAEAQLLRQNAASTRVLLQELTSAKVKLSQELGAVKERIAFAEKRAPELDAEKKLAAAARNFKVAGRLAAEAKVLNGEKEAATADMARIGKELENVEGEAEVKLHALKELDNLVTAKEKEGAMAHCERLRLVAVAAREERDVAIELDDFEEAENLEAEAKAAAAEAEALQKLYQLVGSKYESHDSRSGEDAVSKDKEVAIVDCQRLRLVAAAARDEMEAAAGRDQFDEAETLHSKAEMADAEADRLQSLHQLEGRQFERKTNSEASEDLGLKDKESAMDECERLRLVAAVARDERDTAVELDQFDEAEVFDSKAEAADLEADRLQSHFQLEGYQRQDTNRPLAIQSERLADQV